MDSADSINYATSATYAPPGGLASIVNGQVSGGFAGITTSNSYNNRLFPTTLGASSSNGTALSLSYTYFANGNVNVETNGRNSGRSVTYTYDALNRVSTATSQATSGSYCWGQSFGYDRYANLLAVNVTQCTAPMLSLSVNTSNQITNTGFTYDASGDLTNDGVYTYAWNAAQHLKSAASVTYTYDGDLRRVEKSSGTLYWYTPAGVPLAETDTSGNTLNEYVFFGSARVARRDSSGNVYYYFEDHLGTATTLSNASGVLCYDADFLPFGYENAYVTSCSQNYKFTGLERDGETGLDHTLNRKYDSSLGRWLTPDPKRGNISDPQSLNRYAYVTNNPTALTDPLGASMTCTQDADGNLNCVVSDPYGNYGGGGGGGGGGSNGEGGLPCSNIVMAGGLRPHIRACGSGSAGGGGGRTSALASEAAALSKVASTIANALAGQKIFSVQEFECMAAIETGCTFNPNIVNSAGTRFGLYQFSAASWAYSGTLTPWNGGQSAQNPTAATVAMLDLLNKNLGSSGVTNPTQSAVQNAIDEAGENNGRYGQAVMNCAHSLASGNFATAMGYVQQYLTWRSQQ
jgi:RHS repeat-associated protein